MALHTTMIVLIYLGPDVASRWSLNYQAPGPRLLHLGLFFCLLAYTLEKARALIIDLHPHGQRYERVSIYLTSLAVCLLFIPSAALIILDTVVPY
ncbi:MAG TPA: hypothetical protein PKE64_04755 [Anaerolineae bacterium]|nr:hypothetical protein [Anaerolineae bacterium]